MSGLIHNNLSIQATFDLILVGDDWAAPGVRVGFVEGPVYGGPFEKMEAFNKAYKANDVVVREMGGVEELTRKLAEPILNAYNINPTDFMLFRYVRIPLSNNTILMVERDEQIMLSLNFFELFVNKLQKIGTDNFEICCFKDESLQGTERQTINLVVGKGRSQTQIKQRALPPQLYHSAVYDLNREQTAQEGENKIARLMAINSSPVSRDEIILELIKESKNGQSISHIMESVATVGAKYLLCSLTLDKQTEEAVAKIWDGIVKEYVFRLFSGGTTTPFVHDDLNAETQNDSAAKDLALTVPNFHLAEMHSFFTISTPVLSKTILAPGTFLNYVIKTRADLREEADLIIGSHAKDQQLDAVLTLGVFEHFDQLLLSKDSTSRLEFLIKFLTMYISQETAARKILKLIDYLCGELKYYQQELSFAIAENYERRLEFYTAISNILIKISKSSISNKVAYLTDKVVVNLLSTTEGLSGEFFHFLLQRKALKNPPLLKYIFESGYVPKNEKVELFNRHILAPNLRAFSVDASSFVSELIKDDGYLQSASPENDFGLADVFRQIDAKLPNLKSNKEIVDLVITKNGLSKFGNACIIGLDQRYLLGHPIPQYMKGSNLERLFTAVKGTSSIAGENMPITYLISKSSFSQPVIDLFEAVHEEDYCPFKLKLLKLRNRGGEIFSKLQAAKLFLQSGRAIISRMAFFEPAMQITNTFVEYIRNMTIGQVEASDHYKQIYILSTLGNSNFEQLCQKYPEYRRTIDQSCPNEISLTAFKAAVDKTTADIATRILMCADPNKLTVGLYKRYLSDLDKGVEEFTKILKLLNIEDEKAEKLTNNSKSMDAFIKVYHMLKPLESIANGDVTAGKKLECNILKKLQELVAGTKNQPEDEITLSAIAKIDKNGIVKNPETILPFITELNYLVRDIVQAPLLISFIRTNGDKFIKSMREEVDNENMELVSKLDFVNRCLKFIFSENSLEKVVSRLSQFDLAEQNKLHTYMTSLEGLVSTHIVYLADKTRKDATYSDIIMKKLLDKCTYNFDLNTSTGEISISAVTKNFEQLQGVNQAELSELINKCLLISAGNVENLATARVTDTDEYSKRVLQFSIIGKSLLNLKKLLESARNYGIFDTNFELIKSYLGNLTDADIVVDTPPDVQRLPIGYNKANSQEDLKRAIVNFTDLIENFDRQLRNAYQPPTSLAALFYGQTLHYAMLHFSNLTTEAERIPALKSIQLLYEAQPEEGFKGINMSTPSISNWQTTTALARSNPESLLANFTSAMGFLTKKVVLQRETRQPKTDNFFYNKRVVVGTTNSSTFWHIIRVLADLGSIAASMSQFLYCTEYTSIQEILAFTRRALMDKDGRPHFIFYLNKTGQQGVTEFRRSIETLSNEEWSDSNPRILVLNDPDPLARGLLTSEIFIDATPLLDNMSRSIKLHHIVNQFKGLLTKSKLVMSSVSGLGKTTFINANLPVGAKTISLSLTGDMNPLALWSRLDTLAATVEKLEASQNTAYTSNNLVLLINLDFIEDFHLRADHIDFVLFGLILLGKTRSANGLITIPTRQIFIELGNTFSADLMSRLSMLQLLVKACDEEKLPCVHRIESFNVSNLFFDSSPNSPEQIVGRLLKYHHSGRDLLNSTHPIVTQNEYSDLVVKYFVDQLAAKHGKSDLTYTKYQFWVNTLKLTWPDAFTALKASFYTLKVAEQEALVQQVALEVVNFGLTIVSLSASHVKTSQDEVKKLVDNLGNNTAAMNTLRDAALEKYQTSLNGLLDTWSTKELIIPVVQKNPAAKPLGSPVKDEQKDKPVMEEKKEENKAEAATPKVEFVDKNPNFLLALTNLEMFTSGHRKDQNMFDMKKYIKDRGMFVDTAEVSTTLTEEYLKKFCKVTGRNLTTVVQACSIFRNTGFSLTSENYMKCCLMLFKANLGVPIIMMGESGCGKTYLSHFVAECLLGEKVYDLTLYSGVTEKILVTFMKTVCDEAERVSTKRVWVLFDEFNTSSLQTIIAEIMIDRKCSIDPSIEIIPQNVVFVACCNPYRIRTKMAPVGLVAGGTGQILSHRVYPVPERLIDYVWDFGQLTEQDEESILRGIIKAEKIFDDNSGKRNYQKEDAFGTVVYQCHRFVRSIEERSGVSLRDIKRVVKMYKWFANTLGIVHSVINDPSKVGFAKEDITFWSLVCSIMVCYGLRLNGRKDQAEFIKILTSKANHLTQIRPYKNNEVLDILPKVADFFLSDLAKEGNTVIPEGVAFNRPLKENFITQLACFDTVTPIIICGAPGTSKTLSTHILNAALVPYIVDKYPLFKRIFKKGINMIYYGGSETSTSEGINYVFERGERYIEREGEDMPVVVFDEIGLAEVSPANPLKVLHPLLEKKDMKVGFIGLSNWTLDLSKMNRLIYIARPDMELADIIEVLQGAAKSTLKDSGSTPQISSLSLSEAVNKNLYYVSKSYLVYRQWQKTYAYHPHLHGSRDIYALSKFLSEKLSSTEASRELPQNLTIEQQALWMIKIGIERNFCGGDYEFASSTQAIHKDSKRYIPVGSIQGLDDDLHISNLNMPTLSLDKAFNSNEDLYQSYIPTYYKGQPVVGGVMPKSMMSTPQQQKAKELTHTFTSAHVFKRFFINELGTLPKFPGTLDFLSQTPVQQLLTSSLQSTSSRYVLLAAPTPSVEQAILAPLPRVNTSMSIGKDSVINLFNYMKSIVSMDTCVVLKGLDKIYGGLYDLFNQNFMEVDNRRYCYLYFGESKHRVEINPNFKCIILTQTDEAEALNDPRDIELRKPAPFLNRFEKYCVHVSDVFPGNKYNDLLEVKQLAINIGAGQSNHMIGLSLDLVVSICLSVNSTKQSGMEDSGYNELPDWRNMLDSRPSEASMLMRLTTMNYLLREDLSQQELEIIKREHPYRTLREAVSGLMNSSASSMKLCIYTFSNTFEYDQLCQPLETEFGFKTIKSDHFAESGMETQTLIEKAAKNGVVIIQITSPEHLELLPHVKASIDQSKSIQRVLIFVHLDRNPIKRASLKNVSFLGGWDNRVLDSLKMTNYEQAVELLPLTLEEVLMSDSPDPTIRFVLHDIVLNCYQRISQEQGQIGGKQQDQSHAGMRQHLLQIQRALELDTQDLFLVGLKEKIKSQQIIDPKIKWIDQARKEILSRKGEYVDLEKAIYDIFIRLYGDKTKRLLAGLNTHINNFAGYSYGLLSRNTSIINAYKSHLQEALSSYSVGEPGRSRSINNEPVYKIPFLAEAYREAQSQLVRDLLGNDQTMIGNLPDYVRRYHSVQGEDMTERLKNELSRLRTLVQRGEKLLNDKCKEIIEPIVQKLQEESPEVSTSSSMIQFLLDDIMALLLYAPKVKLSSQVKESTLLVWLAQLIGPARLSKAVTLEDIPDMTAAAVFLLATSIEETRLFFQIRSASEANTLKISEAIKNVLAKASPLTADSVMYDTAKLRQLIDLLQTAVVPNLLESDVNETRVRLETMAEILFPSTTTTTQNSGTAPLIQTLAAPQLALWADLHTLSILLSLIEGLPQSTKLATLTKLENLRKDKSRFNKRLDFESLVPLVESVLLEDRSKGFTAEQTQIIQAGSLELLLGEFLRVASIVKPSLDFFRSSNFEKIILSIPNHKCLEKLCAIVAKVLIDSIPSQIISVEEQIHIFETGKPTFEVQRSLSRIDELFTNLDMRNKKYRYLLTNFIDQLYLSLTLKIKSTELPIEKSIFIIQTLKAKAPTFTDYRNMRSISGLVLLRIAISNSLVKAILDNNREVDKAVADLDVLFNNIVTSKDDILVSHLSHLAFYLLQRSVIICGDVDLITSKIRTLTIVLGLVSETGFLDLMIVSLNRSINTTSIKLNDYLLTEVSKRNPEGVAKLVNEPLAGSLQANQYAVGLALINRFVQPSEEQKEGQKTGGLSVESLRQNYLEYFKKARLDSKIDALFEAIISDKIGLDLEMFGKDVYTSAKVAARARRMIFHFLLIVTCFGPELGYPSDPSTLTTRPNIQNEHLFGKSLNSPNLVNYLGVFMLVSRDRTQGNLGVYMCSCKFMYSIGNCGMAMARTQCPRCGLDIGGSDHTAIKRPGHIKIAGMEELFQIINEEIKGAAKDYCIHPALNDDSTEIAASIIREVNPKQFLKLRSHTEHSAEYAGMTAYLVVKHLMDHLYMAYAAPLKSGAHALAQKPAPPKPLEALLAASLSKQENNFKYNNKDIKSGLSYLQMHISNDFNLIQSTEKFSNMSETLDYINIILSAIVQEITGPRKSAQFVIEAVSNVSKLTKSYEQLKQDQAMNLDKQNLAFLETISRKATVESIMASQGNLQDNRPVVLNYYPHMRHIEFDRAPILHSFKSKLETSQYYFLKSIVRYHDILADFGRMVLANLDLARYFNSDYSRAFSFDEAISSDISKMNDPRLTEMLEEFKHVWTQIIPKYEETCPEVFSFAFMCNQDLNVARHIEQVLKPNGAKVINFVLVNPQEEFSSKDVLYAKGIIRTFLEGFHNKLVKQARSVIQAAGSSPEREVGARIPLDLVLSSDLVTQVDYESVVLSGFWMCPEPNNEREIEFNFERIEYLLARSFLKPEIVVEEGRLPYFAFKNSQVSETDQIISGLENRIKKIPLPDDVAKKVNSMSAAEIESSFKFISEIGDYIRQNFLYGEAQTLLSELAKTTKSSNIHKRFTQFDSSLHAKLKVGHLPAYYHLLRERSFQQTISTQRQTFSKKIPPKTLTALQSELKGLDAATLENLKLCISQTLRPIVHQKGIEERPIGEFVTFEEVTNGLPVPSLETLTFASYLVLVDLLEDALKERGSNKK